MTTATLIAGMGNRARRDDGVGPAVVERIRARGDAGGCALWEGNDPLDLVARCTDTALVVVIDATRSGAPAGTVKVLEITAGSVPGGTVTSTHGLGVAAAVRLARALGRAPRRVVLVGVEGGDFRVGDGLSPAVAAVVDWAAAVTTEVARESGACA